MIFDTDILIFIQKRHQKAIHLFEITEQRAISVQTYMELLQSANNRQQQKYVLDFIKKSNTIILPLTENIGHRASIYIEQFDISHGLRTGDALIAATAVENVMTLCSANRKHFQMIKELDFKSFKVS